MNKLNRICRLTTDAENKVQSMNIEKESLIQTLRDMPGIKQSKPRTPTDSRKRPSHEAFTPNTVTPKSKKSLFVTPKRKATPRPMNKTVTVEKGTQTKLSCADYHVKVMVKYQQQERCYIIKNKQEQKIIKTLINKGTESAVCKHLSKIQKYRSAMKNCVANEVAKEVEEVVKRREDLMRVTFPDDLIQFDWKTVGCALDKKMPTLMSVLRAVITDKKKRLPHLVLAASVLLYGRNQMLNLVQFVLGLVLDSNGLNKEGLNIVHDVGLSVSHTSIANKRKALIIKQEEDIDKVVKSYIRTVEQSHKHESEVPVRPINEENCNQSVKSEVES